MVEQDDFLLNTLRRYGADVAADDTLVLAAASLRDGTVPSAAWSRALTEPLAQAVVLSLKDDADRHWRIHWEGAHIRAMQIIAIGEARADLAIQALGTMAKGDAVKLVTGRLHEAWELLEHAGNLYRSSHLPEREKEIGWARTRIGRVAICIEAGQAATAFRESEQAHNILEQYEVWLRLIWLHVSWGGAYNMLNDPQTAITHFQLALAIALKLGTDGESALGAIYNNLAIAERWMARNDNAITYYTSAATIFSRRGEKSAYATNRLNIALLYIDQGKYSHALRLLYEAEPILKSHYPRNWVDCTLGIIECYLALHRFEDAQLITQDAIRQELVKAEPLAFARLYLVLAQIERLRGEFSQADHHLELAVQHFYECGAEGYVALTRLDQAQLALSTSDYHEAKRLAELIINFWEHRNAGSRFIGRALLILSTVAQRLEHITEAEIFAKKALQVAQHEVLPIVQYESYLLLGEIAEQHQHVGRARRIYQAAVGIHGRLQKTLTYSLHADVATNYQVSLHQLMRIELTENRVQNAFELLERTKNRLLLTYLQKSDRLRWTHNTNTEPLLEELANLRFQHRRLSQQDVVNGRHDSAKILHLERQIRGVIERLYIFSDQEEINFATVPSVSSLQESLPINTLLLSYYDDGKKFWAFLISQENIRAVALPVDRDSIETLVRKTRENNINTVNSFPLDAIGALAQSKKVKRNYATLGEALLGFVDSCESLARLYIVPYGILHDVPFNLLRVDGHYLIEQTEVVMLPTAALLQHRYRGNGHLLRWVGYSNNGQLPHAAREARQLYERWGGELYEETKAQGEILHQGQCRVLHLSTHGVHRVDHHFDRSYLALHDQEWYEDDLLQLELKHELITLSACEVAATTVAPGDEQIGLGRAFLYAGAGALVASLWQVQEELSAMLMSTFYENLFAGASKPAALREAQVDFLSQYPTSHPVYWGGFQFVGDVSPITI